jgi:HTH-type transcriptional regulator/antitoxin HigA
MSTATRTRNLPKDYAGLVALLPPRRIRDEVDLDNATEVIDRLAVLDKLTEDQADYLDTLALLVSAYEDEHHTIELSGKNPLDTLKFLLAERGMSGSDLGRILGQRQLGAAILSGRRRLSKSHVLTLGRYFHVNPSLFLKGGSAAG